ncbi:hypothetical protein RKLH11_4176 [Rhodobacteraceae bacterium KLH11]|nr:hypothetical protein RKLH11_4176 [Rhodobacteraceae bacterium KLH11]
MPTRTIPIRGDAAALHYRQRSAKASGAHIKPTSPVPACINIPVGHMHTRLGRALLVKNPRPEPVSKTPIRGDAAALQEHSHIPISRPRSVPTHSRATHRDTWVIKYQSKPV